MSNSRNMMQLTKIIILIWFTHTMFYILDTSLQLFSLRNRELLPVVLFPFDFSAAAALTANSRHDRAFIGISTGDNGARVSD